jgi:Icc-related predicted phosphoesterase
MDVKKTLRLCHISDTHNRHKQIRWGDIDLTKVDVLICSGDISGMGQKSEVESFMKWFNLQPTLYKVLIAGNHDLCFDIERGGNNGEEPEWLTDLIKQFQGSYGHYYLENSSCEIEGIKFWGSPYSSWFHGDRWAFNVHRGENSRKLYDQIPQDTDVLVTHGPAMYYQDQNYERQILGCDDLLRKIIAVKPLLHLFGHIHEDYGYEMNNANGETYHFNGSICTLQYEPLNAPWLIQANFEERTIKVLNDGKDVIKDRDTESRSPDQDQAGENRST